MGAYAPIYHMLHEVPGKVQVSHYSDFIWPFLPPYMGVIPNAKMALIFPIACILVPV